MKDGKWWVERNILASGNDPAATLDNAGFGDDYTPMIYICGDGHKHPPFGWTQHGVWPGFFAELVRINGVVCHVEVFSNEVTIHSVPGAMADVFRNQKVFGWELDLFRIIARILERIMPMRERLDSHKSLPRAEIRDLTADVEAIYDLGYIRLEGGYGITTWRVLSLETKDPVPAIDLPGYDSFLRDYYNAAMNLRCDAQIHTEVARRIQARIDQYPGDVHLIACGDQHLVENPLYRFLNPPPGVFGVVDGSKGRLL